MKRVIILLTGISMALTSFAQTDSTTTTSDTVRVGNMIIIKKPGKEHSGPHSSTTIIYKKKVRSTQSNVSTNWFIFDLGFTNYNDNTNYTSAAIQDPATGFAPGATEDWFKLRTGKSSNVNIWFFMQRLNVIDHVVNLKYGLGLEMNNYRYKEPIKYNTDPFTQVSMDRTTSYKKNKLAADYLTVPLMLNFNFTPNREEPFGVSVGVSGGYLYASRQKTKTDADGKKKNRDDFDLRPWKLSYIAELALGPVKLYGSIANQSIFEKGLDQTPYSVGVRFSNW
ncbi:MAG: outer membrane beta-barrel protein [Candidatus Pseudobacter hemicellulosilyticus]|uniref:Outer membrane beta-barrel protein n=1 Tax=Candidatus Pseudobacter hemicellulosilyticus TaxID=3121375 RepID=A0AAJ6BIU5_9BACT|nr:MAG: outer membrane beta-barrel protein [Pseudobacter sp.]